MIARHGSSLFAFAKALGGETRGDFDFVSRSWT